jgi:hypothetical protein
MTVAYLHQVHNPRVSAILAEPLSSQRGRIRLGNSFAGWPGLSRAIQHVLYLLLSVLVLRFSRIRFLVLVYYRIGTTGPGAS